MGRLLEHKFTFEEFKGELWKLIKEDTLVWGEPTEAERERLRERRAKIFADSAVPWIVSDVGALLGFMDDIQDILSFAVWNKKIISKKADDFEVFTDDLDDIRFGRKVSRFRKCMNQQAVKGRKGTAAMARCLCPTPRRRRKMAMQRLGPWDMLLMGPLATMLLRFFPPLAPVMYLLLAGQVSASLFGYGIKLGPIIGASVEIFWRGLGELGLPFDRSHNKWYQLKIARAMQRSVKGFGAAAVMSAEDRITMVSGMMLAYRDVERLPELILTRDQYPTFEQMWDDPFGAFGNAIRLAESLLPNTVSYLFNDLLPPLTENIIETATGKKPDVEYQINPHLHAAMRVSHYRNCPGQDLCPQAIEDALAMEEWARGEGLDVDQETNWHKMNDMFTAWKHATNERTWGNRPAKEKPWWEEGREKPFEGVPQL